MLLCRFMSGPFKCQLNNLRKEPTLSPEPYFKSYVKRADVGKKNDGGNQMSYGSQKVILNQ